MARPPRTPEAIDRVRLAVLNAASRVFGRRGYSAATMAEIAKEAGYTAPSVYKYYDGKQVLFEAMIEHALGVIARAAAALPPVRPDLPFEAEVDVLFQSTFELAEKHARTFLTLAALQASGEAVPAPALAKRQIAEIRRVRELVAGRFATAAGSLRIGELEASQVAFLFDALCFGMFLRWAPERIYEGAGSFMQRLPLAKQHFLYGILGVARTGNAAARATTKRPPARAAKTRAAT